MDLDLDGLLPPLFRFAYRMTGSVADAEDIVQECFVQVLKPGSSYDPKRTPILTYLFGVARNQALKRRPKPELVVETSHRSTPESLALRTELEQVVAKAVTQLPEGQREVLILAHYEQLPLAEIASALDIEVTAVKSRLQRARAGLKETLGAYVLSSGEKIMNDTELDDMLNKWDAPPIPRGLRERISQEPPRRKWNFRLPSGLFVGVTAGAAMCLIGITAAFPQAIGPSVRFNLISEYLRYNDDGSTSREYRASTAKNGQEIILEQTYPDNWLMTLHQSFFLTVHRALGLNHAPPASMAGDCSLPNASVVGQETLLGYQTYKLQFKWADDKSGRYIEWRAPALDCIPMKTTWEKRSGEELRLVDEKRPMTVRINRAQ